MTAPVLAANAWPTNGHLIADITRPVGGMTDPFACSVCGADISAAGASVDGVRYCRPHTPRNGQMPGQLELFGGTR